MNKIDTLLVLINELEDARRKITSMQQEVKEERVSIEAEELLQNVDDNLRAAVEAMDTVVSLLDTE